MPGYNKIYITFDANTIYKTKHEVLFDVVVVPPEDCHNYSTESSIESKNKKNKLEEMIEGDETEKAYFIDSVELHYK